MKQTIQKMNFGPCMDVKEYNNHLYVIQNTSQYPGGRLCVLTPEGKLCSELKGLGNARQIEISHGIAVISARENGLWLLEVKEETLRLLAHYQTIEFATGVTLYGSLAFISCRQYGIEIIDISCPCTPKHIGIIRIGEVQSACVYNGYLYGGVWGEMNVAIVDIRDIAQPKLAARIPLKGRGDGVIVKDDILYAVTGQHGRGIKNVSDENDPQYGMGNGLEVFDVSDPAHPISLYSQFFGQGYSISYDMWKPILSGNILICGISLLGVFAYDKTSRQPLFHLSLPPTDPLPDAVTGLTVCGGALYLSSGRSDLFRFSCRDFSFENCYRFDIDLPIKTQPQSFFCTQNNRAVLEQAYVPENAPVLDLCEAGSYIAAACGASGIHLLDALHLSCKHILPTDGCCCDIKFSGGFLFAALSEKGLAIYSLKENIPRLISLTRFEKAVLQLTLSADGAYVLCGLGSTEVVLLDVHTKESPRVIARRSAAQGPLYGGNFAANRLLNGTMLMFWHRDGLVYTNPSAGETALHNIFYPKHNSFMGLGPENGCDTDGENIFYNLNGGYILLPIKEHVFADDLPLYHTAIDIVGKITVCDSLLVSAERAKGTVTVTDISAVKSPKAICSLSTSASPGKPVYFQNEIWLPGGYGGLLKLKL